MTQPTYEQRLMEIISQAILDGQNQIHDLRSGKATAEQITERMSTSLEHHLSKAVAVVDEKMNAKHREFVKEVRQQIFSAPRYLWKDITGDVMTIAVEDIASLPLLQVNEEKE